MNNEHYTQLEFPFVEELDLPIQLEMDFGE